MVHAAALAYGYEASNILTSTGRAATQSVFRFHVHMIPRLPGDQLMLPWGTTGDPHAPHRCKGMDQLEAELEQSRELAQPMAWSWPFPAGTTHG